MLLGLPSSSTTTSSVTKITTSVLSKKRKQDVLGGQTGADRAGLEAARDVGFQTGGFVPNGYLTSAGKDPSLAHFGLVQLPGGNVTQMYVQRSTKNVDAANVTIAFRVKASTGTDKTIGYCATQKWKLVAQSTLAKVSVWYRPCLIVDDVKDKHAAARKIVAFVEKHSPDIINVCGHREEDSSNGGASFGTAVREILVLAFRELKSSNIDS